MLVLGCSLAATTGPTAAFGWLAGLGVLAGVATVRGGRAGGNAVLPALEAVVVGIGAAAAGHESSPVLPYLVAPALAGGVLSGVRGALVPATCGAAALLVGGGLTAEDDVAGYVSGAAQWTVIALTAGLIGAWGRRLLEQRQEPVRVTDPAYEPAYRLLSQLRPVARRLPAGLDATTVAQSLLDEVRALLPCERGAVATRTGGGRLAVLATYGAGGQDWDLTVDAQDTGLTAAGVEQRTVSLPARLDGSPGCVLMIPIVVGMRSAGVVVLERADKPGADALAAANAAAQQAALRLETALLFGEIRDLATADERGRLARQIHDGVAQDLSYLGYLLDGSVSQARTTGSDLEAGLRELRSEITRIVSELRLSIFELRSDVDAAGLSEALSEHVRAVAKASNLTAHLSLRGDGRRLPADVELELLRLAQEAIGEARRKGDVRNLWVTLDVEAPWALLRIEDDGVTARRSRRRDDPDGVAPTERAARLGARVDRRPRAAGGTVFEATVGVRPDR